MIAGSDFKSCGCRTEELSGHVNLRASRLGTSGECGRSRAGVPETSGCAWDGKMATPVPRACCASFSDAPILAQIGRCRDKFGNGCLNSQGFREYNACEQRIKLERRAPVSLEEIKQFP